MRRRLPESTERRLQRLSQIVTVITWVVLVVGLLANQLVAMLASHRSPALLLTSLSIFFVLLLVRLVLAIALDSERRGPLLLLLAGVGSWSLGSMQVNAARLEGNAHFPAPGEWLFLISYLGMLGYLLSDIDFRPPRPARRWLDVAVICGAITSLASLLLVTPLRMASGQDGGTLFLALIYPMADMALAILVLGQAFLMTRADRRKSQILGLGFVLLAAGDSGLGLQVSASTYDFGNFSNMLWGGAFALIVTGACRPAVTAIRSVPKEPSAAVWIGAGAVSLAELTIRPDETLALYTLPPAVVTMACVGARLALALRDANRANEALALSMTDDLTRLPNRRAVRTWLAEGLTDQRPMGLMMLDLDGFKEINDSLGHQAGDTVLKLVAARLSSSALPGVRIARLGGDEFAIFADTDDEIELMELGRTLVDSLNKPIVVEGIELSPGGSIGVTAARADDANGSEVLRRADVAMYQAKNSGLGVALYDVQLDEFSRSRLQLAEELRRGIQQNQIEVWYQPQVDARTSRVIALEALVRWRHPNQGVISPVSFLPAARRAGLMGPLSETVVDLATQDFAKMRDQGVDLRLSINCAPPELLGPTLLPSLYRALNRCQIPYDHLVVEITEDSFISDPQRTKEVLQRVRDSGMQISIDDYGTGFSSLAYLRNLPVHELKIDRSLVANVAEDDRSRKIVASTIQLAHALDLRVVAEGVEEAEHLSALQSMGIDMVQGYHLARPMPANEVPGWVRRWNEQQVAGDPGSEDPGAQRDGHVLLDPSTTPASAASHSVEGTS